MTILQKLLFASILLGSATACFAQPKQPAKPAITPDKTAEAMGVVWKKQIARVIDMGEKTDVGSQKISDVSSETTLIEMFVNLIKGNKILAYTNSDHNFSTRLTVAELNRITTGKKDTVLTTDPVTNKNVSKIITHDFNLNSIHKFMIFEEWSCYPANGKTEIQVIGLAPLKDVFNDDGSFKNSSPMFWLKFSDISAILVRYQQYHPNNTLAGHIWDDYFAADKK